MRLLLVSLGDDRHDPVLVPRNASNTCFPGCFYTISPTTLHTTINRKSPTSFPIKKTSQPHVNSKSPSWTPTLVTTTRKVTSHSPTASPFTRGRETTFSPTVSKAIQPTVSETNFPTAILKPSLSPSLKVWTNHPTDNGGLHSYTKSPSTKILMTTPIPSVPSGVHTYTQSPTTATCKSKNDGTYGTFTEGSSTAIFIDYKYRLETLPLTTISFITSQVLPPLEKAIVDQLIPTFFSASCDRRLIFSSISKDKRSLRSAHIHSGTGENIKSNNLHHQRFLETIVGISASPPDIVQESCNPVINVNNTCVIVKGRLTIFSVNATSAANTSSLQLRSTQTICQSMSDGELVKSQPSITSLQCIDSNSTASISNNGGGNISPIPVSRSVPFYNYILGAAAFGIVLIALFVYIRRKISQKRMKEQTQEGHLDHEEKILDVSGDDPIEQNADDDLRSESTYDAHNLLISDDDKLVTDQQSPVNCSSPICLEDFEIPSDLDSDTAKGDGPIDAYDFSPVLCSIASPTVLASFAKSSYFPVSFPLSPHYPGMYRASSNFFSNPVLKE